MAPRATTLQSRKTTSSQLEELRLEAMVHPYPTDVQRPTWRAECAHHDGVCPFVSCEYHLYLDVSPDTGAIKFNFPHLEVDELPETCALDVADLGGVTLEEVGEYMNLTRERIRQIEVRGLARLKAEAASIGELRPGRGVERGFHLNAPDASRAVDTTRRRPRSAAHEGDHLL